MPFEEPPEGMGGAYGMPDLGMLGELLKQLNPSSNFSSRDMEMAKRSQPALEALCTTIREQKKDLIDIQNQIGKGFKDNEFVQRTLGGEHGSISFFPRIIKFTEDELTGKIDRYLSIEEEYDLSVRGKLHSRSYDSQGFSLSQKEAFSAITSLVERSVEIYIKQIIDTPNMLGIVRKSAEEFDKQLKGKFVKREGNDKTEARNQFQFPDGREPRLPKFEKIKLINGNPVLTETLLEVIESLPGFTYTGKGRNSKKSRTLNEFSVDDAAERLSALSDPQMLAYLEHPSEFFRGFGGALESYQEILGSFEPHHKAIIALPHLRLLVHNMKDVRNAMQEGGRMVIRDINKIKRIDLDRITQNEDDVSPDNRREIDHFKLRQKALDILYEGMGSLSQLPDVDARIEEAKKIIVKAADVKDQIKQVLMTESTRKLRVDKNYDNEYYEGTQEGYGQFVFQRKPAPRVQAEEVIGASFDQAKGHLEEIVETGVYPRLMRMSAPGQKVRSNILLIGPYGCGKTELARAICGNPKVIGASVSVTGTLTAFMHESVNNVKRVYDQAAKLRVAAREVKPVVLVLDEFDGWFAQEEGTHGAVDMAQIENVLLEVLDGMQDYNGIITMAMTNKPKRIPKGILRRFRYVDVVGQLTKEERMGMLEMFLEKSLPVQEGLGQNYDRWAETLNNAPGDVIRKVVDEVHFSMIPDFIEKHPKEARKIEKILYKREMNAGDLSSKDITYVRGQLQKNGVIVEPYHVDLALDHLMKQPTVRMQINAAKTVYQDAQLVLDELTEGGSTGFGFRSKSGLFDINS